jgi:hypothetical protein
MAGGIAVRVVWGISNDEMCGFFTPFRMTGKNKQRRNTEILAFDFAQARMTTLNGWHLFLGRGSARMIRGRVGRGG